MVKTERLGSTRVISPVEPGIISLHYTDRWSAFDRGSSSQLIPGIGAARCACAVKSFQLVGTRLPTHFIEQVGPETIHVQEFSVPDREPLSGKVHGRVLPVEWIWQDVVYGSLLQRIKNGLDPTTLGFASGATITEGMKLPNILLECTTKFEPVDRHLSNDEAMALAWITPMQWGDAERLITDATALTNVYYEAAGFMVPDGKLELGIARDGSIVLVDVFGTQDENRVIEKTEGDVYSKDLIRNWLNKQPWKAELVKAKAEYPTNKSKWPPYPELPVDLVELVSKRYAEVAYRYAGVWVSC